MSSDECSKSGAVDVMTEVNEGSLELGDVVVNVFAPEFWDGGVRFGGSL